MLNEDQRAALQVGQEVGINERFQASIVTVAKRTATQLIMSDGSRWTIKRGSRVGATTWSYGSLYGAEETRALIRQRNHEKAAIQAAKRLSGYPWRNLNREQLQRIEAFVAEVQAAAKKETLL